MWRDRSTRGRTENHRVRNDVSTMSKTGGYDYKFAEQFVSTPLDRYFCVICQHPSRDPHLSVCCGHVFCKLCIDKVKDPCPMCRDEKFVTFPNKQLDREIKNLDVFCANAGKGCTWQGKLGKIGDHLGKKGDCQFEEVKCTNKCKKMIQRRYLAAHIQAECPCRKVICQYCHTTGEYRFIEGKHKEECPNFLLPCPNECEVKNIPRKDMEKHRESCQLEFVSCPNNCGERLKRRYLTTHVETRCLRRKVKCQFCNEGVEYWFIDNQHKEECPKFPMPCPNKCRIGSIPREDMEKHKMKCPLEMVKCEYYSVGCETRLLRMQKQIHEKRNYQEHLTLTKEKLDSTEDKLVNALQQIDALKVLVHQNKLITMAALFESGDQVCPVVFKLPEYSKKVEKDVECYTTSFYTHSEGYRMCLSICPGGYYDGKGSHLSMFLYVMKGIYDDQLTWPLKGTFDIKLLNQLGENEHLSATITFDNHTKKQGSRVLLENVAATGWGCHRLISNDDLCENTPTCQFLKNDCVYLELNFH